MYGLPSSISSIIQLTPEARGGLTQLRVTPPGPPPPAVLSRPRGKMPAVPRKLDPAAAVPAVESVPPDPLPPTATPPLLPSPPMPLVEPPLGAPPLGLEQPCS